MSENDPSTKKSALRGDPGVLIRAKNGDVIQYDETGLILRLSDVVVDELRTRLGSGTVFHDPEIIGDIDAWNVREQDGWYIFSANLNGGHGARDFRRPVDGGEIVAATSGPLFGILSIGGARRAGFTDHARVYPYHVVSPFDDIGAVGLEGTDVAPKTDLLERFRYATRDTLMAEAILDQRKSADRSLPMIMTRSETDSASSVADLSTGSAFENLMIAAENLKNAAARMHKRPRILAVGLDYLLEDVISGPAEYRDGLLALMANVSGKLGQLGYHKPLFVSTFECGTRTDGTNPVILAQWDLAVIPIDHDLVYSAPGYMFAQTDMDRPTNGAILEMAEMDAHAVETINGGGEWACPTLLLAECNAEIIRVTAEASTNLVLDGNDPLHAGAQSGFELHGVENGAKIMDVHLDPEFPKDVFVVCDKQPAGQNMKLSYAFGATESSDEFPANRGALRDEWSSASATGRELHRWALPCLLQVN